MADAELLCALAHPPPEGVITRLAPNASAATAADTAADTAAATAAAAAASAAIVPDAASALPTPSAAFAAPAGISCTSGGLALRRVVEAQREVG